MTSGHSGAVLSQTGDPDPEVRALLDRVVEHVAGYLASLQTAPVDRRTAHALLRAGLEGPLPEHGLDAGTVIEELVAGTEPGLVLMPSGRYFGFVIGGTLPVAIAADWLTTAWDQNAGLFAPAPAAAIVEDQAGAWLKELLGVPASASFALVTGAQLATFTCLAAARHHLLANRGWDVERQGLHGAPRIRVLAGRHRHTTIDRALRFLGMGDDCVQPVATDSQGRMLPDALAVAVAEQGDAPLIVCAQAGEVNTGAFDDLAAIREVSSPAGAWLHIDGAFGLWAAASPRLRHLLRGAELADSWTTDCHKWLNVPYDCGLAMCAHPPAQRAAMTVHADYLVQSSAGGPRDPVDWTPEFSRRARAFSVYAALRWLGRSGVADLVERSCDRARQFEALLSASGRAVVLNQVVLNQVLVRYPHPRGGDDDLHTRSVIERVQQTGVCWMSGTVWNGQAAMRISVSNWRTTEEDVERSVAAILDAAAAA